MRYLVISILTSLYLLWGWLVYRDRDKTNDPTSENIWFMFTILAGALLLGYLVRKGIDFLFTLIW